MATRSGELDFFGHLEELRRNLLLAAAVFLAATVVAFLLADFIVTFLRQPAERLGVPLYFLRPQEKFFGYLRVCVSTALLATAPVLLLLAVRFVAPALTASEKRFAVAAASTMLLLFAAGVVFALSVVIPIAIAFFAGFRSSDGILPLWSFGEYLRIVYSLLYAFCVVFEAPIALLLLLRTGLLQVATLTRHRRHALLLILLLAALITPPDVVSQVLLAGPLYLLYEGTILVARIWLRRKGPSPEEADAWTAESS